MSDPAEAFYNWHFDANDLKVVIGIPGHGGAGRTLIRTKDKQKFLDTVEKHNGKYNLYTVVNKVDDSNASKGPFETVKNEEITKYCTIYIDLDPKRKLKLEGKQYAANKEEITSANIVADAIYDLLKENGFPEPLVCFTGNGFSLDYVIDLDMSPEKVRHELAEPIIEILNAMFASEDVEIDASVVNEARLRRIPGSKNVKADLIEGDSTERIHRYCTIEYMPDRKEPVPLETLKAFISNNKVEPKASAKASPDGIVTEGGRHKALMSYAGYLHGVRGMGEEDIYQALALYNAGYMRPPKDDTEIRKIAKDVSKYAKGCTANSKENSLPPFQIKTVAELIKSTEKVEWLIQDWIAVCSKVLISGPPKSMKSTIGTDELAVSVASGKHYLGHYEVKVTGPVLIYQGENTLALEKDRFKKIMASKGISVGTPLPIHIISNQGLALNDKDSLARLREAIAEIKPVLVLIDPWYMATAGDLKEQKDMTPVLNELTKIRDDFKCTVGIVTHDRKSNGQNRDSTPGVNVYGTMFFSGWYECGIFLNIEGSNEEADWGEDLVTDSTALNVIIPPKRITIERAGRMSATLQKLLVTVDMGAIDTLDYKITVEPYRAKSMLKKESDEQQLDGKIVFWIGKMPGESISGLAKLINCHRQTITDRITELAEDGRIIPKKNPNGGKGYVYYLPEREKVQVPQEEGTEAL